jgi:hypothetical protein
MGSTIQVGEAIAGDMGGRVLELSSDANYSAFKGDFLSTHPPFFLPTISILTPTVALTPYSDDFVASRIWESRTSVMLTPQFLPILF